ncbi:MAG TPA: TonB-dependent receptor, partial [Mucilaginibacter sp.]|nr:TonB-dependent receptor [Mucilaginibacter sp.]
MRKFYLLISLISCFFYASAQTPSIRGKVYDMATNSTLPGAIVQLDGTGKQTVTDVNGNFQFTGITPGSYTIKIRFIGFDEIEKKVDVSAGRTTTINIPLSTKANDLKEVSVFGSLSKESDEASRATEKNSNNLLNVIGAQAIQKSPDINAANVLQRVSGVTIQRNAGGDDAFAIIRGLEPRYNNTLINGVSIASPDSKTRLVSLSVVPSDLLEKIEVNKTLLPEMEGDAIGGTVDLIFKDAPDRQQVTANASIGYEQLFIDRKFLDFSKADIHTYSPSEMNGPAYIAQPNDFTRSNLDFRNETPPPSETFAFTYGNRYFNKKLGFIIGDSYQNNYFGSNSTLNDGNADPNSPDHRPRINDVINRSFSSRQILNNMIAHLDYKLNDKNKLSLDNVLLYSRIEEAQVYIDTSITGGNGGRTIPGTGPVSTTTQSTTNNQIMENLKLSGNHILTEHLKFDWYGAFSDAFVRTPDQAGINTNILISYDPSTGFTKTPNYFDAIDRTWSHNNDKDYDFAANLTYKAKIGDAALELKGGGLYRDKTRYNYEDEYILRPTTNVNGGKAVFTDINSAQWIVYNPYGAGEYNVNNYNATEKITAVFGQFKLAFPKLDIYGGVRAETTSQDIHVRQDITNANEITKGYTDILPSISIKYKLNDITNLRAAYYSSIARPAYYELVPTVPPTTGTSQTKGNPDLLHTTSNNVDIRYELFPKPDEQFFVGVYYKLLTNPIEYAYLGSATIQPINSQSAKVAGVELAYTRYFGNVGISGNYAYN